MCFSKKIFYFILLLFYNIFYFPYCSIDCKYEYFCTTGNENFKCVFLKFIFFKLAGGISYVLVDLKLGRDLHRMYLYRMNHGFQNLTFLYIYIFFLSPKRRKAQGKSIFKLQNAAIFLIFEISLFPWFMR